MRCRPLLPFLFLTACTAPVTPDARYVGALAPNVPSALCKPGRAVLRLRDGQVLFTPDEGTWSLTGVAAADGTLSAERIGSGVNRNPYPTRLAGNWTREAVDGTYTTPHCTYAVSLNRQ